MTDAHLADLVADRLAEITAAIDTALEVTSVAGELSESSPQSVAGGGLMIVATAETGSLWVAFSEAAELLPDWVKDPDEAALHRIRGLAETVGAAIGQSIAADSIQSAFVDDLTATLPPSAQLSMVSLPLQCGDAQGQLWIGLAAADTADETQSAQSEQPPPSSPAPAVEIQYADLAEGITQLPLYSRSLLKIRVPVLVTLASTKMPVGKIVELGPGAIIQFAKSCEETLSVEVGDRCVAVGEAVKVGDKFGLRITSIVMPDERFRSVRPV